MPDLDRLLNAIEQAEAESYGSGSDGTDGTLSEDRAAALDAYFGRNTFPAPDGNSQVISRDLFDTVEWIIPSLTRIFAGSDEVVKIDPVGPDDVQQAEQEGLYLNHIVTQQNRWEQVFHDWAWDALVTKNAYCLAYWDDSKEVEYERYERQTDDALAMLMDEDGIEVLEHSQEVDEKETQEQQQAFEQAMMQWQQMAQQAQMQGQMPPPPPQQPQPVVLHEVKIRRTRDNGKACIRVLPPERCLVHQSTPNYTLDECDFFEYWEETSISRLRAMGFDVDDDIDSDERGYSETQEDSARDLHSENVTRGEAWEPSMRKVRARMCWIRHDYDGDGIAELQYVLVVGRNVLWREECNRIPVASIVATPVPHRHIGVSIADVVLDIQETKTEILRQGINNLYHANNSRLFINEGKVNLDDALVSRPGGVVRGITGEDVQYGRDIAPIVVPNIFPQAMQGLEYMDSVRENRTGTNRYFTGVDQNALNKTASGISQLTSSAAQRVEQIARMMSPSVEHLFSCMHEIVLKHGHKQETVRLKGEWATVDPSNWRRNRDLKISVGLGSGSRDAMLAHLAQIFAVQMQTMPLGVTDPSLIYNTLAEMTKASGFATEAQFWKKPGPPQPQLPPPELMIEKMRQEFEGQKVQLTEQSKAQIAQMQAELDRTKLEYDSANSERERELKRQIAEMQEATKLTIAQMQQEHAANLEAFRAQNQAQATQEDRQFQMATKADDDARRAQEEAQKTPEIVERVQEMVQGLAQVVQGSQTVGIEKIKDAMGKTIGGRIKQANGQTREVKIQ